MSERTRFQSQILLQLSRLARWCSGLARSYSSKRKGLHRSVRLRSNTCTSTTRFRKFRGTEFRALRQDTRFESFSKRGPRFLSKKFFSPSCIAEPAFAQSGYAHPGGWRVSSTSLQPSTPYSNRRRTL